MRIAVFGANGRTGREVMGQAVDSNHQVTAVARDTTTLSSVRPNVQVAAADVLDLPSVEAALDGVEAVIATVGGRPRQPTTVHSDGIAVLETGMHAVGIRRLICLSAALPVRGQAPFAQRVVSRAVVRLFFRDGFADMAKMEAAMPDRDVDWTVVRVPGLTAKPGSGHYRVAEPPLDRPSTIPRSDLAAYLVSILDDPSTYRKIVEISS